MCVGRRGGEGERISVALVPTPHKLMILVLNLDQNSLVQAEFMTRSQTHKTARIARKIMASPTVAMARGQEAGVG